MTSEPTDDPASRAPTDERDGGGRAERPDRRRGRLGLSSDGGYATGVGTLEEHWRGLAWWALGLVLLVVLADAMADYLPWFILGLFAYYVARPLSRRIEGRVGSRSLAAGLTVVFLIIPIIVLLAALVTVAVGQVAALLADERLIALLTRLVPFDVTPAELPQTSEDIVSTVVVVLENPDVQTLLGSIGGAVGVVMSALFNVFLSLLLALFLLISDRDIADWFQRNVFGEDTLATRYFRVVDQGLTSVYYGYTMTIFAVILLTAIIYTVFNLFAPGELTIPFVVLLALLTGLFTLVPVVGRSVIYLLIVGILAVQAIATGNPTALWFPVVFFLVMVVAFDNLVRTYIRPRLSGRMYAMGLIMFAYLLGPSLYGWYGIFLGPLVLVVAMSFLTVAVPTLLGRVDEPPMPAGIETEEVEAEEPPSEESADVDVVGKDAAPGRGAPGDRDPDAAGTSDPGSS